MDGVYEVAVWGDWVEGVHSTNARFCTLNGVAKKNWQEQPYVVANEYICGRLALFLGLPVAPGVIVRTDDEPAEKAIGPWKPRRP